MRNALRSLRRAARALFAPAVAALLAAPAAAQAQKLPVSLRVASYNLHHGEGTDGRYDAQRTARIIEAWQPDVIALQEIDSATARSGKADQLGDLARLTRYYPTFCATMPYQGGKYGIGLLSRRKPQGVRRYALPGQGEPRVLLVADFKDYAVACTHLSLSEQERMASLSVIETAAKEAGKPFIIAGDWNDTPSSPFIKALSEKFDILTDTRRATYPSAAPKQCLDYIAVYKAGRQAVRPKASWEAPFIGEPAVVTRTAAGNDTTTSDHLPVMADLLLPTPKSRLLAGSPYLQLATPTSVSVMFQTNSVSHCWVEYGTDSLHMRRARTLLDGQEVCFDIENCIRLDSLRPGTRYFYRVCATELLLKRAYETHFGGDTLRTRFYSFRTPSDRADDDFTCAIFNDLHENEADYANLRRLLAENNVNPDFVIFNGDCLPEPSSREHALRMIHALADPIGGAERPIIFLRGNHEIRNFYSAGMHRQIGYIGDKTYSAFTRGDTRFVLLDCGEDKPDQSGVYAGLNDFTQLRLNQQAFLREELKSKAFKQAKHRVLVSHIPVFGNTDSYRPCLDLWGPLLKKAPFDVSIAAHTHRAAFHPQGADGCAYPVYVGGGPSVKTGTVCVLSSRSGRLSMRVLSSNPDTRWSLDL